MSLQERKIAQCTPNQLEMKPNSPALASETSHITKHAQQVD